jgi:hypothetical protein
MATRPRITAILNCYALGGNNVGQLVFRRDGSSEFYGEATLIAGALAAMGAKIPPAVTAALPACPPVSSPPSKKTKRKASSGHASTAAAVE